MMDWLIGWCGVKFKEFAKWKCASSEIKFQEMIRNGEYKRLIGIAKANSRACREWCLFIYGSKVAWNSMNYIWLIWKGVILFHKLKTALEIGYWWTVIIKFNWMVISYRNTHRCNSKNKKRCYPDTFFIFFLLNFNALNLFDYFSFNPYIKIFVCGHLLAFLL